MENNNDQKRITVNVDAEIYAQLERVAKESGIQIITAVVRQAIVFYLSQKATLHHKIKKEDAQ